MEVTKAIEVIQVSKRFRDNKVMTKISLSVNKGETVGIIGRNGSGKTVLFKCICGLMSYDEGDIIINGRKINGDMCPVDNNIGVIIETPGFMSQRSGWANLKHLAAISGRADKKRIAECMEFAGLNPKSRKPVRTYSLGMKQRLAIAQAILERPDILILDEPMNGLDNSGVRDVKAMIRRLREEGKAILIASHNDYDIKELCDRVYEIDGGEIRERGVPD